MPQKFGKSIREDVVLKVRLDLRDGRINREAECKVEKRRIIEGGCFDGREKQLETQLSKTC